MKVHLGSGVLSFLRWCATAWALALLAACATPSSPGEVARNWSCKLREMQISPVFPPREDLHVGDIFWFEQIGATDAAGYCQQGKEFMPTPPYVAYLNVTADIDSHYNSRPQFARTTSSQGTVTVSPTGIAIATGSQGTDASEGTNSPFTTGSNKRTRLVGFPDFMTVHVSRFALGAIIPIDAVLTPLGIARENVRGATLSIPVAESYSVPAGVIAGKLQSAAGRKVVCDAAGFMNAVTSPGSAPGQYQVVNEVFYTRAIDVNISAQTAFSVSAARSRSNAATTALPAMTTTGIVTESVTTGSVTQNITRVSEGMMNMLQSRGGIPGVSVAYEQGDELSVKMRRIFDRPVAIGYRSIGIAVGNSNQTGDCTILGARPIPGVPPMAPMGQ